MRLSDPFNAYQLSAIQQIIADEILLEGRRRGCAVLANDPVVRENVCCVILRIGHELRERAQRTVGASTAVLRV